jgi:hypothetical protein
MSIRNTKPHRGISFDNAWQHKNLSLIIAIVGVGVTLFYDTDLAAAPRKATPSSKTERIGPLATDGLSRKIDEVFNKAIAALVDGRGDDFLALLSSSTIERETRGSGAIDKIIRERFIPYFSDFKQLTANASSVTTTDPEGHKGIALCRSFEAKDQSERPFIMYIVEEDGDVVVSNLLLNKRLRDLTPQ